MPDLHLPQHIRDDVTGIIERAGISPETATKLAGFVLDRDADDGGLPLLCHYIGDRLFNHETRGVARILATLEWLEIKVEQH